MNRKSLAAGVILAAALVGCGTSGGSSSKPTPSPTPTVSKSQKFLDAVGKTNILTTSWSEAQPSDAELTAFPPKWCAALAQGHSVEWMLNATARNDDYYPVGQEWGTNIMDARSLVVLGVTVYCPEYLNQVTTELRDSGQY